MLQAKFAGIVTACTLAGNKLSVSVGESVLCLLRPVSDAIHIPVIWHGTDLKLTIAWNNSTIVFTLVGVDKADISVVCMPQKLFVVNMLNCVIVASNV